MERLLCGIARGVLGLVQRLPLGVVARLGRAAGGLAYRLDARHRRVALENLTRWLGAERSPPEIAALARENFRRIGENFACGVRTSGMSAAEVREVLEVRGVEKLRGDGAGGSCVVAIGHFGNFELYAHGRHFVTGYQFATTYRALRQPALNRLLQDIRRQSGCLYFERRTEAAALRAALQKERLMLGFLADQHAGDRGLRLPFLGRDCSTSAAPALFALRYALPLHTAIVYRTGPGRWRIEVGDAIPTREHGRPRRAEAIALDMNRAFEAAVRRDPANWFWVHRRWKPGKYRGARQPAAGAEAREARVP
ncbi:MAG: lysophospholipid acyltransferase family protein [Verrucomicrobia bacterium]|nr:lysophospholipid acyltransferase family protein [Verrucomicrobiota bacterium]